MRVALGADHAGYLLKTAVAKHLIDTGHEVSDLGTSSEEPSTIRPSARRRARRRLGRGDRGIAWAAAARVRQSRDKVPASGPRCARRVHRAFRAAAQRRERAVAGRADIAETYAIAVVDVFLGTKSKEGVTSPV